MFREVFDRLKSWWGAPVIINRLVMFLYYLGCAAIGVGTWLASSPTLDHAVGHFTAAVWGICVGVSGVAAAACAGSPRLEIFEQWAVVVLCAMLISFVVAVARLAGYVGADLTVYTTIAAVLSLVPIARASWLIAQSGKRKRTNG